MTISVRVVALLASALLAASAQAGSSLRVVVNVALSTGSCGASVTSGAVNVSCGSATLPSLPPVSGVAGTGQQVFVAGTFGASALPFVGGAVVSGGAAPSAGAGPSGGAAPPAGAAPAGGGAPGEDERKQPDSPSAESSPQQLAFNDEAVPADESALRQVGILPAWATGNSPMAVYSAGVNLSSWRVVSNDNVQHVELTISW